MSTRNELAWYVCGPMTRIPRFNYPLFDLVTAWLRLKFENVISPTELDSEVMQDLARASLDGAADKMQLDSGETWGDVLARDVRLIEKQIGHFALLPGWERSRGARLEVFVGLLVGVESFNTVSFDYAGEVSVTPMTLDNVRETIRRNMP